ncbi:hypothetical protein BH10ACT1_BH10ACT1_32640 [soil metagenome]
MDDASEGLANLEGLSRIFPPELRRFLMVYGFAIEEVTTKIEILRSEYAHLHDHNPIEHVSTRLKEPQGIIDKARRRGSGLGYDEIRANIRDIAGVRVTCSFVSDVYTIFDAFCDQADVRVVEVEDYIADPKPNGYQSLHAIIEVPVFLSGGPEHVCVEMQFRTVAMDFWASLEHKIYYKYDRQVPDRLIRELKEAADTAAALDQRMERLHREVAALSDAAEAAEAAEA